jgi:hypothetical protein
VPKEIKTSDIDRAEMESWTEEQWARADHSGLLDRLEPSDWPDAARTVEETGADGMCKVRIAYRARHEDEDYAGCEVWEEDDGRMLTSFPPPTDFDGDEEGEPGSPYYRRTLTQEELASMDCTQVDEEAEQAEWLAEQEAARRRFFGLGQLPRTASEEESAGAVSDAPSGHLAAEGHLAIVADGGGGEIDFVAGGGDPACDFEDALRPFELVGAASADRDLAARDAAMSDGAVLPHVAGEVAHRIGSLGGGEADGLALDRAQGEFAERPPVQRCDTGRVADLPLPRDELSIAGGKQKQRQRGGASGVDQPHFDPPA